MVRPGWRVSSFVVFVVTISAFLIDTDLRGQTSEMLVSRSDANDYSHVWLLTIEDRVVIDEVPLTEGPYYDAWPAWSPDHTRVAFARAEAQPGDWDIYVLELAGGAVTNLSQRPRADDVVPDWSPDGKRIVFVSENGQGEHIYVMNDDGSNLVNLTGRGKELNLDPDWSCDDQIAFGSFRDGNEEIYVMSPDGTGLRNLTNHASHDSRPVWSPDAQRIVFSSTRNSVQYPDLERELFVMNADGTDPTPFYATEFITPQTCFSPDGDFLALTLTERLKPPGGLFVMAVDPTAEPLYLSDGYTPDWAAPEPCAETDCADGIDNDADGLVDCEDEDCANDPVCTGAECGQNKDPCETGDDCCSGNCRRGRCRGKGKSVGDREASPSFLRGDANADGDVNLGDAVHTLNHLFLGGPAPRCADAADSDDNGRLEITDAVFTLHWLFLERSEMPPPGADACGLDETADDLNDCEYDGVNC